MRKLVNTVLSKLTNTTVEVNKFSFNGDIPEDELMEELGFVKIEGQYHIDGIAGYLPTHRGFIVLDLFNTVRAFGVEEIKQYINGNLVTVNDSTINDTQLYVYTGMFSKDLPDEVKSLLKTFRKNFK